MASSVKLLIVIKGQYDFTVGLDEDIKQSHPMSENLLKVIKELYDFTIVLPKDVKRRH